MSLVRLRLAALPLTLLCALSACASATPQSTTEDAVVGAFEVPFLAGTCAIPSSDGAPPVGCQVTPSSSTPEVRSRPGELPVRLASATLALTVVSGPVPDAIVLENAGAGRWNLEFKTAPAGRYELLLVSDTTRVAALTLVVDPDAALPD